MEISCKYYSRLNENKGRFYKGLVIIIDVCLLFPSTEHINHIRDIAGVNHVGIGADFDGINK